MQRGIEVRNEASGSEPPRTRILGQRLTEWNWGLAKPRPQPPQPSAGLQTFQDAGDLRSEGVRGRETRAQQSGDPRTTSQNDQLAGDGFGTERLDVELRHRSYKD